MISIANEIITNKLIEISKNKDLLNMPIIHDNILIEILINLYYFSCYCNISFTFSKFKISILPILLF